MEILGDPYVVRCGSEQFCWSVLQDPQTLEALRHNDVEAFNLVAAELERERWS